MDDVDLEALRQDGSIGLDLSPGNRLSQLAYEEIVRLRRESIEMRALAEQIEDRVQKLERHVHVIPTIEGVANALEMLRDRIPDDDDLDHRFLRLTIFFVATILYAGTRDELASFLSFIQHFGSNHCAALRNEKPNEKPN